MDLIGIVTKKDWTIYRSNGDLFAKKELKNTDPIRILLSALGRINSNAKWRKEQNRFPSNYVIILNGFPKEETIKLQEEIEKRKMDNVKLTKGDYLGITAQKVVNLKVALFYGVKPIVSWPYQQQVGQIEEVN